MERGFWHDLPRDRPVVIAGPTARGKSALALEIAETRGGVIVNADALQVWDCWRKLSARPSPADEARAAHRLYGHLPRGAAYSVGDWLREAAGVLAELKAQGKRPVFVGGTGLYLSALTKGLAEIPPTPPEIRAEADVLMADGGVAALLAGVDADTASRIDRRNPARVQRAWEVQRATGRGLVEWQAANAPPLVPLAEAAAVVLDADRDWLAARIDARFMTMIEEGAVDEVRAVLPFWDERALWANAIGGREIVAHLRGETDLATAITLAQATSRQYAKRQRTWFRARMQDWTWLPRP